MYYVFFGLANNAITSANNAARHKISEMFCTAGVWPLLVADVLFLRRFLGVDVLGLIP